MLSGLLIITSLHLYGAAQYADSAIYRLTTVSQLEDEDYSGRIETFYDTGKEGTFTGEAGVPIYYKIFRQRGAGPAIMISSGRTEAAIKYKELIFDLYNNGYSVYIHDHRGQGLSGRMTEDPEMGYIDSFQFYVNDMKSFYEGFIRPAGHTNNYLMAHSMGGAIAMTYLEQHPDDFDAAVFSSPMLGLSPPICMLAGVLNRKKPKYAPGKSGYDPEAEAIFEGNTLTGSEVRFRRAVEAYARVPEARLGGPAIQWVHRSCKQFHYLFEHVDGIETPFIVFSAENEQIVDPRSHRKFVENAQALGKECELHPIGDARHELFVEKDPQRQEVLRTSLSFFERH
ncbi:MAG: alpha/beta fold hydrolase [Bacteroidales bacterium]